MKIRKISYAFAAVVTLVTAIAVLYGQGFSFFLQPGFSQHVWGVTNSFLPGSPYLGGVAVRQNGDVIAAECDTNLTRLHIFDGLHPESIGPIAGVAGGCGIALHPDGFLYSNMNEGPFGFGVARIDLMTGAAKKMGLPGNALGIAVDPRPGHYLVYAGQDCKPSFGTGSPFCTLFELDPVTEVAIPQAVLNRDEIGYVDGIAFSPSGDFIFLTNRYNAAAVRSGDPLKSKFELVVLDRVGGFVIRQVPMMSEPVGIGFHATSPKFVVTNNQDGTMTRFDFPNDDYTAMPTQTVFASGGFRGDLMQAGPDGCLYVTQDGVYDDQGDPKPDNSIVQICGGFAPPAGITPNPCPPPVISGARVTPDKLWPPNGRMVDVKVDYTVSGGCAGTSATVMLSISSNQGGPSDWQIVNLHLVRLRARREGGRSDRIYTITITATDPAGGGTTKKTVQVVVPHDQG